MGKYYAVVNFKGKFQDLNHICESRNEAVAYYRQITREHPRIEFRVWDEPMSAGHYRADITDKVRQELGL